MPGCTAQSELQTVAPTANVGFTGLGDLHAGFKAGPWNNDNEQVTVQLSTSIPTGDTGEGLGTGHHTIEPYLLYAQRVSEHINIFGELGDVHPIGGARSFVFDPYRSATEQSFAGDVVNYGVGASYGLLQHSHCARPRWTVDSLCRASQYASRFWLEYRKCQGGLAYLLGATHFNLYRAGCSGNARRLVPRTAAH